MSTAKPDITTPFDGQEMGWVSPRLNPAYQMLHCLVFVYSEQSPLQGSAFVDNSSRPNRPGPPCGYSLALQAELEERVRLQARLSIARSAPQTAWTTLRVLSLAVQAELEERVRLQARLSIARSAPQTAWTTLRVLSLAVQAEQEKSMPLYSSR